MAKKSSDSENGIMHVGIPEPGKIRKAVLNSAIVAIQLLKRFEIYKRTLKEKDIYRKEFVKHLKDARSLIKESIEMLPPAPSIDFQKSEPPKPKIVIKPQEIEKKLPKREKTHLDELEDDIDNLKGLISDL